MALPENPKGIDTFITERTEATTSDASDMSLIVQGGATKRFSPVTRSDLASTDAGKGASLVGLEQGGTVQEALTGWRTPQMFGAVGDGVADDTQALQDWLNAGGGRLPVGNYRITDTLVVGTRRVMRGENNVFSASPSGSLGPPVITWDGAQDGVMLQVAQNPVGTTSSSARSGVVLNNFLLDGNGNTAGIGLYANYVSDSSYISDISVRGCRLFGVLAAKLWYSIWERIVARNCEGVGIALGWNWDSSYDTSVIHATAFKDLQANGCGVEYNASTAPTGFDLDDNPIGGCGVYVKLSSSSQIINVTGENCYGPGVVLEPNNNARSDIQGVYVEANMATAVADGASSVRFGLLLYDNVSQGSYYEISSLYGHAATNNNVIRYKRTAAGGGADFIIDLLKDMEISSDETGVLPILTWEQAGSNALPSGASFSNHYRGRKASFFPDGLVSGAAQRNGTVVIEAGGTQNGWASESTVDLATVTLQTDIGNRSVGASVLLHVNYHASNGAGDPTASVCETYLVNITAYQRFSASMSSDASVTVLGTITEGTGLSAATPTVAFSSYADGRIVATIQVVPTSTRTQSNNSLSTSAVLLGGGARGGLAPRMNLDV